MSEHSGIVYQTGQKASTTGIYEVMGLNLAATAQKRESASRLFRRGEVFPSYEGWEVCWSLRDEPNGRDSKETFQPVSGESLCTH
jgi:hypothetical protein